MEWLRTTGGRIDTFFHAIKGQGASRKHDLANDFIAKVLVKVYGISIPRVDIETKAVESIDLCVLLGKAH
jgi:hypothetical protein